jgi:hypothetical protein
MLLKRPRLKPWKLSLKVWYTSFQVLTCINMWKFWLHACVCSSLNWFYGEICACNLVLHAVQVNLRKRLNIWQKQFLSILHQQSCMPQEVHYHCFFFVRFPVGLMEVVWMRFVCTISSMLLILWTCDALQLLFTSKWRSPMLLSGMLMQLLRLLSALFIYSFEICI